MRRILIALAAFVSLASQAAGMPGEFIQKDNLFPRVKLETTAGTIVIELDRMKAAVTVNNFLTYVDKKVYDNSVFHRLEPDFVLQGGGYDRNLEPIKGFAEIPNESGNGLKNIQYSVAMAHQEKGPHTATSQFFINLNENTSLNPGKDWGYAVFGNVVEGMDVIEKIRAMETTHNDKLGWDNVPKTPIVIARAIILPPK